MAIETGDPRVLLNCVPNRNVRLESLLFSESGGEHNVLPANGLKDMLVRQVLPLFGPEIGLHVVPQLDD
jgi:hypothetical protein